MYDVYYFNLLVLMIVGKNKILWLGITTWYYSKVVIKRQRKSTQACSECFYWFYRYEKAENVGNVHAYRSRELKSICRS